MLNFFKLQSIQDYIDLLRCVKKLRILNIPTPITEKFEGKDKLDFVKTTWYENQGEHWQGWVNGYKDAGFYNRKNNQRSAKFIYNHIMCPAMFVWMAENVGIDKKIILQAVDEANKTEKYQTQCRIMRKYLSWEMVEKAILKSI
jgi:hypothetical protein